MFYRIAGSCFGVPPFSWNCTSWFETWQHIDCTGWAH